MADALTSLTYSLADLLSIGSLLIGYYLWRECHTYYHRAFYSTVSRSMPILKRVWQLRAYLQQGLISEAEFNRQKAELFNQGTYTNVGLNSVPTANIPIGLKLLLWLVS
jgi:hypothetical protein